MWTFIARIKIRLMKKSLMMYYSDQCLFSALKSVPLIIWSKCLSRSAVLPPSRSLPRCGWMAFALPWLSVCLFSGLSDRRSILHGGVASLLSRILSCRWSGWLLDEYLRACQNITTPTFTSAARLLACMQFQFIAIYIHNCHCEIS